MTVPEKEDVHPFYTGKLGTLGSTTQPVCTDQGSAHAKLGVQKWRPA